MTSFFDQTADQREKDRLPRFIVRPPRADGMSDRDYDRSWVLIYEWSVSRELDRGWECRSIDPGRLIVRPENHDYEGQAATERERIARWAEGWLNGSGTPGLVWREDREAVIHLLVDRLREATADGFLMRALAKSPSEGAST